jgi:4-hydroxy-tetrahydrodipicolinate reductase
MPVTAGALVAESDVVIDFSSPAALRELLVTAGSSLAGRALVVGTTGLGEREQALLEEVSLHSPVVVAANYSIGVNLLLQLVQAAARVLSEERFDIEVVEAHHRRKVDAPSGTALARCGCAARAALLETVRRDGRWQVGARPAGEIGIHSVRGGGVVGEHRVHFLGESERLELTHIASDRGLFAEGALLAARWAAGRAPGRYRMSDVLGF